MNRMLIIDGDPIAWRASYNAWSDKAAAHSARAIVTRIVLECGGGSPVLAFSCRRADCFRTAIYPAYKAHRNGERPPFHADALSSLKRGFIWRELPGLEADDVVGILATHPQGADQRFIVADDHDLLTIPGQHYSPTRRQWQTVDADEADRRHLLQTLVGDTGDGYPGCPGIGPGKAGAMFAGTATRNLWAVVVKAFRLAGKTEADALTMARLARILRADDYDLATHTVNPWTPATVPAGA